MDIIRFAIENPVKIAVGVILIILFGLIALISIPVQLTPDVDPVIITVTTEWTGRSPDEVEKEIIEEQEDVLKNIDNLKKMTASAVEGRAEIELEFFIGTDLKAARQDVSDSLREVPEYPDDVDEPVIVEGEAGAGSPVAWLLLTSTGPDFDVQALGDPAEDRIKPYLERTAGVSEVRVYGGREREVQISFDPSKVAQRGITFNQLRDVLEFENVNTSAGTLTEGRYEVRIRTIGQYDELDQVRKTVVAFDDAGGPIRIEDLASVDMALVKRRSFVRSRGELSLALPIYREAGSNVMQVMSDLKQRIAQINDPQDGVLVRVAEQIAQDEGLSAPPTLKLELVYEETGYIEDALSLVQSNLVIGGSLAVLALLIFLRSVRPTLIVALAIPVSVIGTFVVMYAAGRNVNVISLAGLAFAVGMVVDNAIVVLENIDRHLAMGKRPMRAAYDASKEVWGAILASTLTTLAVFIPVLTIQEEAGQLFKDIALAICAAVTLSLIVSITVIPSSASRFVKAHAEPKTAVVRAGRSLFGLLPIFSWIVRRFADLIHWLTQPTVGGVYVRVMIVLLFTVASIVGSALLMPPSDYLPAGNQNLVFGMMLTPPGYNIEQNEAIARQVEAKIRPYWEAQSYEDVAKQPPMIHPFTGQPIPKIPPIENYFFVTFFGGVFNGATSQDKQTVAPLADLLTAATSSVEGSIGFAAQSSLFGRGAAGTRAIDVEIAGDDMDAVVASASALRGMLQAKYGPFNVQPDPMNFDKAAREVQVRMDRVKASEMGMNVDSLGRGIASIVEGIVVGDFEFRGESIDVRAKRDESISISPEGLMQTPVAVRGGADGQMDRVPLGSVATAKRTQAAQQIKRIEERRAVKLTVTPPNTVPLEQSTNDIREMEAALRAQGAIPSSIDVDYAGSASKLEEVRTAMLGKWTGFNLESVKALGLSRIFIALLVTYLLMAALFESFLYPFVIMFSVPLATVGGFLGLRITHEFVPTQQLDTLTMLGFVILIGVVVNNAILLVHQALNFMRGLGEGEGDARGEMAPREAIRESVRTRIRPIFMTTLTSVCGMMPLVIMSGSGSELYRGLGSVVVGGLVVSTLFTLIVVPLLFSLVIDTKAALYRVMQWQADELEQPAGSLRME